MTKLSCQWEEYKAGPARHPFTWKKKLQSAMFEKVYFWGKIGLGNIFWPLPLSTGMKSGSRVNQIEKYVMFIATTTSLVHSKFFVIRRKVNPVNPLVIELREMAIQNITSLNLIMLGCFNDLWFMISLCTCSSIWKTKKDQKMNIATWSIIWTNLTEPR